MTKEQIAAVLENVRSEFAKLPTAERLDLLGDLWDSMAADADTNIPLTDAQKIEIDRRLAEHDAAPSTALDWSVVRAELWSKVKAK